MNRRIMTGGLLTLLAGALLGTQIALAQDKPTCDKGMHLFEHKLLATAPVCIPDNPQRIVAFDMAATELLLFTDKQIVGSYDSFKDEMRVILPEYADKLAAIPDTGLPPNPELITKAKPDLIVTLGGDEDYQFLSQIAPTVVIGGDTFTNDWKSSTEFWSEAFGVQDVYQQMVDIYDKRVEALQKALGDDRSKIKVSLMTANPGWTSIWLRDSAQGKILQDVGLGRPESQDISADEAGKLFDSNGYETISEERLDLADGDVLFMFGYASTDADTAKEIQDNLKAMQQNLLWQHLKVVQAKKAFVVGPYWYRGLTYLQANMILDDLFRDVAQVEPDATEVTAIH